jgi:hypothetical protein
MALDVVGVEQAMNPETIESDFVDRHNLDRRCNALLGSLLEREEQARANVQEHVSGRDQSRFGVGGCRRVGRRRGRPRRYCSSYWRTMAAAGSIRMPTPPRSST